MNNELMDVVKEDLVRHEGYVTEIYLCSEGYPTFGIGHMVTEADMEHTWPVGTPVTDERILDVFKTDCEDAYSDACALFLNLESHPVDVQRVVVNMAFNLGRNRLGKFKNMIRYVNEGNYLMAANEMIDSKWYRQVGRRSAELVDIMKEAKPLGA
jgi:lysozyme